VREGRLWRERVHFVLAVSQAANPLTAVAYVLLFGLGSMLGMGALSAVTAVPASGERAVADLGPITGSWARWEWGRCGGRAGRDRCRLARTTSRLALTTVLYYLAATTPTLSNTIA
jgi:hypothetical protein